MPAHRVAALLLGFALLGGAHRASAQEQNWAAKLFDKQKIDFGTIARGSDARFRLKIKNIYPEQVHLQSVSTTCGCSAATPSKTTLAANEEAYIEVKMDTERFSRRKDSNVVVVIDAPHYARVQIPITAYIRTDVVLSPGAAALGAVAQSEDVTKTIEVAYAGRDDWKIKEIKSPNEFITTEFAETRRAGGRVDYQLKVTLKSGAPIGALREQLTIVTDDANSPEVPLLFEARVESEFTVTPETVALGRVNPNAQRTFNIVVRGRKPFAISKIECESTYDGFKVTLPQDSKQVHVLPITLTIPGKPGAFDDNFVISIADAAEPVKFRIYGEIVE